MDWRITAILLACISSIAQCAVFMGGNAYFNTAHDCAEYFTNGVPAGLPPQPDIAWWKFNEAGGSNVIDFSTRGTNNLILNNTAMRVVIPGWFNAVSGHTNNSLGYYAYTSNLMNFGTSVVTISFWHYKLRDQSVFPVPEEDRTVFTLGPLSGTNQAVLNSFIDDNAAQLISFRQDYNSDTLTINYNPSYGNWKHYVVAFDVSTTEWLITSWTNGVGGGAAIGSPLTAVDYFSTNTFWLFNDPSIATSSSGLIADFRIYSGLRTNLAEALYTNAPNDCVSGSSFVGSHVNTLPASDDTCDTARDSVAGTTSGTYSFGGSVSGTYNAVKFVAGASTTICRAVLRLHKQGTPVWNANVQIWSHNSGADEPDALIGTGSDFVAGTSFPTSEGDVEFVNMSAGITSGTTYWLIIFCDATGDASNRGHWNLITESPGGNSIMRDANGVGPWSSQSTTERGKFTLYSQ